MKDPVQTFLSTHLITDNLIKDFCNRGKYGIAEKEIPRAIEDLYRQISDLEQLRVVLLAENIYDPCVE